MSEGASWENTEYKKWTSQKQPAQFKIQYPEEQQSLRTASALFDKPYLIFAPEQFEPGPRKLYRCIRPGCSCSPTKRCKSRDAHMSNTIVRLVYCSLECNGNFPVKKSWSVFDDEYFQLLPASATQDFPFIVKRDSKCAYSKELINDVTAAIRSGVGVKGCLRAVERMRMTRYYFLLRKFSNEVSKRKQNHEQNGAELALPYLAPSPLTPEEYQNRFNTPTRNDVKAVWLRHNQIRRIVSFVLMKYVECRRRIVLDGSLKYNKRLRTWDDIERRYVRRKGGKILVLFTNEIGQPLMRVFAESENKKMLINSLRDIYAHNVNPWRTNLHSAASLVGKSKQ
ncbi:hypothetical protein BJ741DRAFT_110138 [Chytriomyces cf. hyalinus JEL632]|nr:hypothetical protein BJ741DRAFT_110138 [Chytriomyces cf. hyalinus JEL632]